MPLLHIHDDPPIHYGRDMQVKKVLAANYLSGWGGYNNIKSYMQFLNQGDILILNLWLVVADIIYDMGVVNTDAPPPFSMQDPETFSREPRKKIRISDFIHVYNSRENDNPFYDSSMKFCAMR